jgi:chromosomal replication initiation ATPase DnaA
VRRAEALTGLRKGDLLRPCRNRTHAWARFAVMKVANDAGRRVTRISEILGLDHSSVTYGIKRAAELEQRHCSFAELVRQLKEGLAA